MNLKEKHFYLYLMWKQVVVFCFFCFFKLCHLEELIIFSLSHLFKPANIWKQDELFRIRKIPWNVSPQRHFGRLRLNSCLNGELNTVILKSRCMVLIYQRSKRQSFNAIVFLQAEGLVCHSWPTYISLLRCERKLHFLRVLCLSDTKFDLCSFPQLKSLNVIWS